MPASVGRRVVPRPKPPVGGSRLWLMFDPQDDQQETLIAGRPRPLTGAIRQAGLGSFS